MPELMLTVMGLLFSKKCISGNKDLMKSLIGSDFMQKMIEGILVKAQARDEISPKHVAYYIL